ncbi:flagellar biosynthesis anti-sigma factor FlgM [Pectinatus sottacetonis]|uniref:flagellar biosynthesis anti-sigma factor FlgM n=1 Tax=Pectinatus sottacetonis TaxID=1002795 RepID=UPI0018C59232|nr:flagellar biosynthesis anti-sigma factor FlgM [Pectinatus sottacetonis]
MISNSSHINSITNLYVNKIDKVNLKTKVKQLDMEVSDKIVLSNESQKFAPYLNKLRTLPDARMEKVQNYSKAIESGTYKIDASGVADSILQTCFL